MPSFSLVHVLSVVIREGIASAGLVLGASWCWQITACSTAPAKCPSALAVAQED